MLSAKLALLGPSVLLFSAAASYYDTKFRRIPNWLVARILIVSLLMNAILIYGGAGLRPILLNVLYSLVVSLLLWGVDFWAPGDVKFFFAMSTLVGDFFTPLVLFFATTLAFSVVESLVKRQFKFKPLSFSPLLVPLIFSPLMLLSSKAFTVLAMVLIFHNFTLPLPVLAPLILIYFFLWPGLILRAVLLSLAFGLVGSFEMRGELPSAPFFAVSFIYTLFIF